jgi:hypothetical protein
MTVGKWIVVMILKISGNVWVSIAAFGGLDKTLTGCPPRLKLFGLISSDGQLNNNRNCIVKYNCYKCAVLCQIFIF